MLEMLLNPRRAEKRPIEMLFVGIFYSFMSLILTNWIFSGPVLAKYSGIVVITFTVMFSMPFMYYLLRHEEEKEVKYNGSFKVIKEHSKAIIALLWLFIGFVIAFAVWYVATGYSHNFKAQIETYCNINHPSNFEMCVDEYTSSNNITGMSTGTDRFFTIFFNNVYVLMFTIIFSLIFGAGAIFILAWNASVIAVAMGIFTKMSLSKLPLSFVRYMIHGLPEIAAYFIGAVAGGIVSMAIIKQDFDKARFKEIVQDFINLIIIALVLLLFAGLTEIIMISYFA